MALTDERGGIPATMLVGPTGAGGGGNGGWDNGNGWWIILLFILLASGNWGGNNGSGGYGQPILVNDGNGGAVQRGFDQASIIGGLNGIQAGMTNGFNAVTQQLYTNQIADMQNAFAMQSQFANCCCENRLATAGLAADIAREACADRAAVSDGIRDLLVNNNANTQRILDQLCSDKIDAKNERIADLERQLTMANLAASQNAQTSRILADNAAQTVALEQYLNPTPIPAYVVQNPSCCQQNTCGCGSF